ncbi:hypothetical protein HM1_1474 [Heliomicrobium modesticaldum Ice1]|uniref:Uncharacterized protein n=1 Tax=Heliobacterium modesticaldum (strain ATCC 51547 / Ice1) TaxID=498761 RepID=B0TCM1_HELMI|nr:hypothetical protein HM1_1474 [Heliomicrobium modesticaldum Ice1]
MILCTHGGHSFTRHRCLFSSLEQLACEGYFKTFILKKVGICLDHTMIFFLHQAIMEYGNSLTSATLFSSPTKDPHIDERLCEKCIGAFRQIDTSLIIKMVIMQAIAVSDFRRF